VGLGHDGAQVLLVHPGLEAGLEVALDHAAAVMFEDFRPSEAAEQRLAHARRIDAALAREVEGLGQRDHADAGENLVAGLGHLPRSAVADQGHRLAELVEQRLDPFEHPGLAADHDGERGVDGTDLAARHRRVEKLHAQRFEAPADAARGLGIDGRHVDDHQAFLSAACGHAAGAEHHRLDIGHVGHHGEYDVGVPRHLGGAGVRLGGDILERVERGGAPRPQMQRVAGPRQVQCHGAAHEAKPDESDIHLCPLGRRQGGPKRPLSRR